MLIEKNALLENQHQEMAKKHWLAENCEKNDMAKI
jgi:hypothetical protein